MTRKRAKAIQTSMARYGISFVPRPRGGIFSILSGTDAVISPSYYTVRCGMELVERAEQQPAIVASEMWQRYLGDDSLELVAYA